MKYEWKTKTLGELTSYISKGIPPKYTNNYSNSTIIVLNQKCNRNFKISYEYARFHDLSQKKVPHEKILKNGDILINSTGTGTAGRIAQINNINQPVTIDGHMILMRPTKEVDNLYYGYALKSQQKQIELFAEGSTGQTEINKQRLINEILITYPSDIKIQHYISSILSALDDKIELNNKINENLEMQAQAIFDNMFPNVIYGEHSIGEYITPKRGKNLLSKNTIFGNVPVVAGGLEPSTYHNKSNTIAPVLTISASGANAGYVNLWTIPIWASDSSFIDFTMTENVYFWYVMLKKRQKEIFESQTGSAQPHIYPKHIAILPVIKLNQIDISKFTNIVTPLFNKIGNNKIENQRLAELRDTLLPKLMNGEIDVDDVQVKE